MNKQIIFLSLLLISILIVVYIIIERDNFKQKEMSSNPVCNNGQTRECYDGSCKGIQVCEGNDWSSCYIERVCEPGAKKGCYTNGCSTGYSVCNVCGQWSGCITIKNNS